MPFSFRSWLKSRRLPTRPVRNTPRAAARPSLELLEDRRLLSTGQTFLVDDPGNPSPTTGTLTLAQAIADVNADTGTGAADVIQFNISGSPNQVQTINVGAANPLPAITQPVVIDGWSEGINENDAQTYNGPPLIVLHGDWTGLMDGLDFTGQSGGSTVQGLVINGFDNGIHLATSGNLLQGNYFGTDAGGATWVANINDDVLIDSGATGNTVGGTAGGLSNLISGAIHNGVEINGASNNLVAGNFIGTDVSGSAALWNDNDGVLIINGATGNTVGSNVSAAGNLISGNNNYGVEINGASNNLVLGNYIGTDLAGAAVVGNNSCGVILDNGAQGNTVGGTTGEAGNLISGNYGAGVILQDAGTGDNLVLGNRIGTNAAGTAALANGTDGVYIITGASQNTIGSTISGAGNLISGNRSFGIDIESVGTTGNVVLGNSIGTDVAGTTAVANGLDGIFLANGASENTVGGTASGAGNLISGNLRTGVDIVSAGTSGNVLLGNSIGTNAAGTAALANGDCGVQIAGTSGNTVGGTANGAGNLISGNSAYGVAIAGAGSSGNVVLGNKIGTDVSGTAPIGNSLDGVWVLYGATDNTVGGTSPGAGNLISGNGNNGVFIGAGGTSGNVVLGNKIGTDATGNVAIANTLNGVLIAGTAWGNTLGGTAPGAGNLISGNGNNGVEITDSGTSGNLILGNLIGTNAAGTAALANTNDGLMIYSGPTGNTVGGTASGAGNVISGNSSLGVLISASGSNLLQGNLIGTDVTGAVAVGNAGYGIFLAGGAPGNTVGGTASGAGNVISGNGGSGVLLSDPTTSGNLFLGNKIGTDVTGTSAVANNGDGVDVIGAASGNIFGSATPGGANVISGNAANGVVFNNGSDNAVLGDFIGTNAAGTAALGNGTDGVLIYGGGSGNTVGGSASGAGNLISGNDGNGIEIDGNTYGASGNVVLGNKIGTDLTGTAGLRNGNDGVIIEWGAVDNTVGGTGGGAGNLISANGYCGVELVGSGTSSNLLQGNRIGTDITGTATLGNNHAGVLIGYGVTGTTVGGTAPGSCNLISGNTYGLQLSGSGATGNVVQGNRIGTNAAGTAALANGNDGVVIDSGATGNTVACNLISGNGNNGVEITVTGTSANVVQGNRIGTNAAGTAVIANRNDGIAIDSGATGNTVGGTAPGAGNLISGNRNNELEITGANGNVLLGNRIGTDATGTVRLGGNGVSGVFIALGSSNNTVGGTANGAGNLLSGNQIGLQIVSAGTSGNVALGNKIGTDLSGTVAIPNVSDGVLIGLGATGNTVGGTATGAGNLISGNGNFGVEFFGSGTSANLVLGDLIGTDWTGTQKLPNTAAGVYIDHRASGNTVGGTATGSANVISGNGGNGVLINGSGTTGNVLLGNLIGTDVTGTANLGNTNFGALVNGGAAGNTVGGMAAGDGNTIAWNAKGVVVADNGTTGIAVLGNCITCNTGLGIDLGNDGATPNGANPRAFANDGQNAPRLSGASGHTVSGQLTAHASTTYRIEFFACPVGGAPYQGKTYLGYKNVTTGGGGAVSFSATVATIPAGSQVTATATNMTTWETSEFASLATSVALLMPPSLAYSTSARWVTLSAQVCFGSTPVPRGMVRFSVVGVAGSVLATVNSHGVATVSVLLPAGLAPGLYTVSVSYLGSDQFLASSGVGSLVVNKSTWGPRLGR